MANDEIKINENDENVKSCVENECASMGRGDDYVDDEKGNE